MVIDDSAVEAANLKHIRSSPIATTNLEMATIAVMTLKRYLDETGFTSDDETTLLRLAVRLINDAGACGKCAAAGYYQQAVAHIRDLIEVAFLLDLFRRKPEKIAEWRTASEKDRKRNFKPIKIREELNALDGSENENRKEAYEFYSGHGTHVTPDMSLISPEANTIIGPFADEKRVVLITYDLTKWLCIATSYFLKSMETSRASSSENGLELAMQMFNFSTSMTRWLSKSR